MGRGVSCGGGQSSLGYLFGSGESDGNNPPPPAQNPTTEPPQNTSEPADNSSNVTDEVSQNAPSETVNKSNPNILAPDSTAHDSSTNNYHRADGQNCGNFITNRPSTKVHAAPGGSSSLGYLFTGDEKK